MPVFGQKREAKERWFGHAVKESVAGGPGGTRRLNREEAAVYFIATDATGPILTAQLPKDVRNERLGLYVTLVCDPLGQSIDIDDTDGTNLDTLAAGSSAMIVLTDNSTAAGTWLILKNTGNHNGRTKLS